MSLTWRERLRQHPRLVDTSSWPPLDAVLIQKERRRHYLRNTRVVQEVLAGVSITRAAKTAGLSPGRVTQLLNRCLGGAPDIPPALRQGLVPHHSVLRSSADTPRTGRFLQLLEEVPGLRSGLDEMLLDRLKDRPWAEVPSPARYHALFKNLLARANWPLDAYPYTFPSLAYEATRRDMHRRWAFLCQVEKSRLHTFTRPPQAAAERWLYDRIEIDEQIVDCEKSAVGIEITFGAALPPMRLPRLTLLAAIDTATDCILGFQLALTRSPQQDDLLALLQLCLTRWPSRAITTAGLELPAGAGFPQTAPDLPLPLPREIALDNAWMHHAHSIESFVTGELGATLSFGRPKSPTIRRCIETAFNRINQRVSHRFASTTGSSISDPKRESATNRKRMPMMSLSAFEDALYIAMAEANHRPRAHLGAVSPLDVIRLQAKQCYTVDVDDHQRQSWDPFREKREVVVHARSDPKRKPYVNFEFLRYKGPCLLAVPPAEKKVLVVYDRRDIRQIQVYRLNREALGSMACPPGWRSYAHSLATRRYLFKEHRALIRGSLDPLTDFLRQRREELRNPSDLANFLRRYQEFVGSFGQPSSLWPKASLETAIDDKAPAPALAVKRPARPAHTPTSPKKRYWSIRLNPGGGS